jgi:3-isopropylmalate dehydrogenase
MLEPRTYRLAVMNGDGIGPEITPIAMEAVDAALASAGRCAAEWVDLPFGRSAIDEFGDAVPPQTLKALTTVHGWILGPHDSASYPEPHRSKFSPGGIIRRHFNLFANIRPAKSFPGSNALVPGTDLVVVRENTEGFYADRNTFLGSGEFMPTPDTAISLGIFTRGAIERIAHTAFQVAEQRDNRLTVVHKANVLKVTTGFFLSIVREVGLKYPHVDINDFHIDALVAKLVRKADQFDVIITENMFGDILSDLTGELAGSLGMAPSLNASDECAMAQASHGSAPDIAGKGMANPIAIVLSAAMLLRWIGARHADAALIAAAGKIEDAVMLVASRGVATPDMGGSASTAELGEAIVSTIGHV